MNVAPPADPSSDRASDRANDRARVRIFRYDPSSDDSPRYDTFQIPLEKGMVILDVLRFIYENLDGSLAYEHGCRFGRCGICAVRVNGRPQLACQTLAEPTMVLEPLDHFPIVRDLVVDRSEAEERVKNIHPYLMRRPGPVSLPEVLPPSGFETFRKVSRCIGCSACFSSCPSFALNRYTFDGPATLVELARYAFDPRDSFDRTSLACSAGLFNCFQCGKCQEVCPIQIPIQEMVLERFRHEALARQAAPAQLYELSRNLSTAERPFIPLRAGTTFLEKMILPAEKAGSQGERVGLFIGCTINSDPRVQKIGFQALELLPKGKRGIILDVPGEQVCCGLPWMEMGDREAMQRLVEKNVLLFEKRGVNRVISLCPGCGMVMKKEWPKIFQALQGRPPRFQVEDISEFLLDHFSEKEVPRADLAVSFHDSCHLGRGQGIYSQPREILSRMAGVEIREMAESDQCCGGGGMVRTTNWKLAQAVAGRKIERLKDLGVGGVVTTCPTCLLQLSAAIQTSRTKGLRAYHLLELIKMYMDQPPFAKGEV